MLNFGFGDCGWNLLVEMTGEVSKRMLTFDNGRALRIGSYLAAEVLEDGALGHAQSTGHIRQICYVGFYTVQPAFLSQFHLRHLVTVSRDDQEVRMGSSATYR